MNNSAERFPLYLQLHAAGQIKRKTPSQQRPIKTEEPHSQDKSFSQNSEEVSLSQKTTRRALFSDKKRKPLALASQQNSYKKKNPFSKEVPFLSILIIALFSEEEPPQNKYTLLRRRALLQGELPLLRRRSAFQKNFLRQFKDSY